ncbi:hypothetical protein KQ298_09175 [Synechococcus sp. CS-1330]|nr:hypothetical protein [Synechococcus sp. CS-1330]
MLVLGGLLALLGACLASVPARPTAQAAGLLLEQEAALLQQLATADRQWLPRAEILPSGAVRYHYRRRANEPKLSVAELRALIANPPSFGAERLAIGELLTVLAKAGVLLELGQPRKLGAAGEWDPAARTLRIQPRVVAKGSVEFARVLNHEAIHVAQSCSNRGLRSRPLPLGLPSTLPDNLIGVLQEPVYSQASEQERQLEREAYANQSRLNLGAQLVRRHC